jgi:alkylation response protein AidB-like acyl-CoA dehydrogenase
MFTMMNNARLGVAVQGVGIAEAAFQHALAYAEGRVQGRTPTGRAPITDHADVRRMLARMRAQVFSSRAIALSCAVAIDMARATDAPEWHARAALLDERARHAAELRERHGDSAALSLSAGCGGGERA